MKVIGNQVLFYKEADIPPFVFTPLSISLQTL